MVENLLAPLQGEFWGAAEDGVVVRTSTGVPVAPTPLGPHRLRVEVEGHPALVFASLEDIPLDAGTPPTGVRISPVPHGKRRVARLGDASWLEVPIIPSGCFSASLPALSDVIGLTMLESPGEKWV